MTENMAIIYDPFSGSQGVEALSPAEMQKIETLFSGSFTKGRNGPLYNDPLDFDNLLSGGLPGSRIHGHDIREVFGDDLLTLMRRLRATGVYAQRSSVSVGSRNEEFLLLNTSQFRERLAGSGDGAVMKMPRLKSL